MTNILSFGCALLLLSTVTVSAQISYREIAKPDSEMYSIAYDSTFDFSDIPQNINPSTLVGQTIYFTKINRDFYTDTLFEDITSEAIVPNPGYKKARSVPSYSDEKMLRQFREKETNVYKPISSGNSYNIPVTPYSAFEDQSFIIVEASSKKEKNSIILKLTLKDRDQQKLFISIEWQMYMEDKWSKVTNYRSASKMMAFGHFESYVHYLSSVYRNQRLVYVHDVLDGYTNPLDLKIVNIPSESHWLCSGITYLKGFEKRSDHIHINAGIYVELENDMGYEIAIPVKMLSGFIVESDYNVIKQAVKTELDSIAAVSIKEYNRDVNFLNKKFGKLYGKSIADGNVMLGMTKEMCLYSWGMPYTKTQTIIENKVIEVWYYSLLNWLRFTNGRLTLVTSAAN